MKLEGLFWGLVLILFTLIYIDRTSVRKVNISPRFKPTVIENPIWYSTLYREGVIIGKTYYCPAGKLSSGVGNTQDVIPVKDTAEAFHILRATMKYYRNVISKRWSYLNEDQINAVVSLAMNCKWDTVFNSSFSRRLDKQKKPNFINYCKYFSKRKSKYVVSYNLLQCRLYEQGLFDGMEEVTWRHPITKEVKIFNIDSIQSFYKKEWVLRVKYF